MLRYPIGPSDESDRSDRSAEVPARRLRRNNEVRRRDDAREIKPWHVDIALTSLPNVQVTVASLDRRSGSRG
jgi:hypothetical protein